MLHDLEVRTASDRIEVATSLIRPPVLRQMDNGAPSVGSALQEGLSGKPAPHRLDQDLGELWWPLTSLTMTARRYRNGGHPVPVPLDLSEVGRNSVIRPAAISHLRPLVIVTAIAPDIKHSVDRTRPTEPLAPRCHLRPGCCASDQARTEHPVGPPDGHGLKASAGIHSLNYLSLPRPPEEAPLSMGRRSTGWRERNPPIHATTI